MSHPLDLQKLEALSCLAIREEEKASLLESLEGVVSMLHDIDNVEITDRVTPSHQPTPLAIDQVDSGLLFDRHLPDKGIHAVDGVFLAPKVIHRD